MNWKKVFEDSLGSCFGAVFAALLIALLSYVFLEFELSRSGELYLDKEVEELIETKYLRKCTTDEYWAIRKEPDVGVCGVLELNKSFCAISGIDVREPSGAFCRVSKTAQGLWRIEKSRYKAYCFVQCADLDAKLTFK